MNLSGSDTGAARKQEPLHVIPIALGLILAAFAGGGLGLIWNSATAGSSKAVETEDKNDDSEESEVDAASKSP